MTTRRRRRGYGFSDVVLATSLAVTMIGVGTNEIARQHAALRVAADSARVRATLSATYERLRVGLLVAPAAGERLPVAIDDAGVPDLQLELIGLEAPAPGTRAVEIRASWAGGLDGARRERSWTTLVAAGGDA